MCYERKEEKATIKVDDSDELTIWWKAYDAQGRKVNDGYMTPHNGDQTIWCDDAHKVTILNNQHHLEIKGDILTIIEIEGKKITKTDIPISDLYRWEEFIDPDGDSDYIHVDDAYQHVCDNPPDRGI
jgi:hypothetical protein